MNLRIVAIASLSVVALLAVIVTAQEQQPAQGPSLEAKRQFVRTQMIREFADSLDENLLTEIDRKVAAMSPERIDQLVKNYQKRDEAVQEVQTGEARLQQSRDEAFRQAKIAEYQQRLAAARAGGGVGGRPGFAPVITTLPSGTQLGASAVVSPDRRYVRMSLQPFFSSVGPVQTFTFQNSTPYRPPVQIPLRAR